jgi:hypothetical protein
LLPGTPGGTGSLKANICSFQVQVVDAADLVCNGSILDHDSASLT